MDRQTKKAEPNIPIPPRVLAINDLSGHSHTSLMAIIPLFQTLGIGVTALPTALLSSNTEAEGFELIDLEGRQESFLKQWKQLGLTFDAIYSGFLSSELQMEIVLKAIWMFSLNKPMVVVDPVMGDDGALYPCFSEAIVKSMHSLIVRADLLTPNLTEAALLLDEKYNPEPDENTISNWCIRLAAKGPGKVVITNVRTPGNTGKSITFAYDATIKKLHKSACDYLPANYPGTGDIFTTVLTAYIIKGEEFFIAVDKAVAFVSRAIALTMQIGTPASEGICLEKALPLLNS